MFIRSSSTKYVLQDKNCRFFPQIVDCRLTKINNFNVLLSINTIEILKVHINYNIFY